MMTDETKRIIALAGGAKALAARLGIKQPSIYSWRKVPPARAREVSKITGVPVWEIRPDLYDAPAKEALYENTGVAA